MMRTLEELVKDNDKLLKQLSMPYRPLVDAVTKAIFSRKKPEHIYMSYEIASLFFNELSDLYRIMLHAPEYSGWGTYYRGLPIRIGVRKGWDVT